MAFRWLGSPTATWSTMRQRLKNTFAGADPRVCVAFWLFGLMTLVTYVIILSAALDLVGPDVPTGVVLLADIVPSLLGQLVAPYFIHLVPYDVRVILLVAISTAGMLIIALTPGYANNGSIATKMFGVVLASLSSGLGELSFLGMTHYYGSFSLAAWSSGTGAAGLIGAGVYALATTVWGFTARTTLLASACFPALMIVSFYMVLPLEPLQARSRTVARTMNQAMATEQLSDHEESEGLLGQTPDTDDQAQKSYPNQVTSTWNNFAARLQKAKKLFFPYMLPLLLVYIAEYTINQGVSPTLLFPLQQTPFKQFRAFYPTYSAIYQCGVFISRSSSPFLRIHNLYLPSLLQVLNLAVLTAQSLYGFIPSVYIVFAIILWEGLLGGLVYINTFAELSDTIEEEDREFSLNATAVSDSAGICIAGLLSMSLEVYLCKWQVAHGRKWCKTL